VGGIKEEKKRNFLSERLKKKKKRETPDFGGKKKVKVPVKVSISYLHPPFGREKK